MTLDLSQCRLPPFEHQIVGIDSLVKENDPSFGRVYGGCFFLMDEMGAGKSLQVIVSSQILHASNIIDRVIVVCPNSVRDVWFDDELGELAKHLWLTSSNMISEYRGDKIRQWALGPPSPNPLKWIITNTDLIRPRNGDRKQLNVIKHYCTERTWLIIDESSAVSSPTSAQSKACLELRRACGRVTLLNGTPISNSPSDLFMQAYIMDPRILGCQTYYQYRARYAVMGGFKFQGQAKQIVGWLHPMRPGCCDKPEGHAVHRCYEGQGLDEIQQKLAPYVLRRLKKDCIDLPDKMPPVAMPVPLTEKTWAAYKSMRDECVLWLTDSTVVTAPQAIVKVMRLAQVTSGFIGGVEEEDCDLIALSDVRQAVVHPVQEIGREKLDFFLTRLEEWLVEEPLFKAVVFCRFRPELARLMDTLREKYPSFGLGEIRGDQTREERQHALRLLDPRTSPNSPVLVGATPGAGSLGLNLTAAWVMIRLSNDYSLRKRLQGDDRIHRPGQVRAVSYYDIVATGPQGQRTVDYTIALALRDKENLANWTTGAWVKALKAE